MRAKPLFTSLPEPAVLMNALVASSPPMKIHSPGTRPRVVKSRIVLVRAGRVLDASTSISPAAPSKPTVVMVAVAAGAASVTRFSLVVITLLATDATEKRPLLPASVLPRSEEHTSELQSLMRISYAVFCLKKKTHDDTVYF